MAFAINSSSRKSQALALSTVGHHGFLSTHSTHELIMQNPRFLFAVLGTALITAACASDDVAREPGQPLPNLTEAEMGRFLLGKAVFTRLTSVEEGLGPTYNQTRCSGCHAIPVAGGSGSTENTLGKARRYENGVCDVLAEEGGDIIQVQATPLAIAAGINPPEQTPPSATIRVEEPALAMFGLGLVQAIPDEEILSRADPDDADDDGISGRAARDASGLPGVGRWTRKGERGTLLVLVDAALRRELGLTTPTDPVEQTVNGVPVPPEADPMPDPEMDERQIGILTDFIRFLAPPARAPISSAALRDSVEHGEQLFDDVGCAVCHTPTMWTGPHESAALDRKPVNLYSDILLHDMGPEEAALCGLDSSPSERRTTWLWGLRLKENYMYDGLATTVRQSIERHGGESAESRDAFEALTAEEQAALLRFLSIL
jgi:CxxC motif-containing protein (DUF1111 family)